MLPRTPESRSEAGPPPFDRRTFLRLLGLGLAGTALNMPLRYWLSRDDDAPWEDERRERRKWKVHRTWLSHSTLATPNAADRRRDKKEHGLDPSLANTLKKGEGCRITRITNVGMQDSKRCFLMFPGILFRGYAGFGSLPEDINKRFGAAFEMVDYPKRSFREEEVVEQIAGYLRQKLSSGNEDLIICGLSQGGLILRKVLLALSPEERARIKHHVGLAEYADADSIGTSMKEVLERITKITRGRLRGTIRAIVRGARLPTTATDANGNRITIGSLVAQGGKDNDYRWTKWHGKSLDTSLDPDAAAGRTALLYSDPALNSPIDVPTTLLHSQGDPIVDFSAKDKVKEVFASHEHPVREVVLHNAGHPSFVRAPQWMEAIDAALSEVWSPVAG